MNEEKKIQSVPRSKHKTQSFYKEKTLQLKDRDEREKKFSPYRAVNTKSNHFYKEKTLQFKDWDEREKNIQSVPRSKHKTQSFL